MKNDSSFCYGNYNTWGGAVRIKLLVPKLPDCVYKTFTSRRTF